MIKAVFFDIDGTLVSFKTHKIPQKTMQALHQMKEKGILLIIATGRSSDGLKCLEGFPFDGYITLNGQYCYRTDGSVIHENTIRPEDMDILFDELSMNPFPCGFTMRDHKIYNYRDARVEELHSITQNDAQPAGDITSIDRSGIYQLQAFINDAEEKHLLARMKGCTSARWYPTFCDISPLGGTKVKGMDCFAKAYGFTMAETAAFGDGGNDIAMIEHAGIGIAMGNSVDALKEAADYTCGDVDDNGLVEALQHFHLV